MIMIISGIRKTKVIILILLLASANLQLFAFNTIFIFWTVDTLGYQSSNHILVRWEMYLQVLVDITLNLSIYLGRSVSRVGHEKILVLFSQIFSQYLLVPCLKWSTQTYERLAIKSG